MGHLPKVRDLGWGYNIGKRTKFGTMAVNPLGMKELDFANTLK